jgi:hypothetical protein
MREKNTVLIWITLIFALAMMIFTISEWIRFETINQYGVFATCLAWSFFFNTLTWGNHEGPAEKDELDEHIQKESARISYYIVLVAALILLFVSDGTGNFSELTNYPLLFIVGMMIFLLPMVEFLYSKKYKS